MESVEQVVAVALEAEGFASSSGVKFLLEESGLDVAEEISA